MPESWTDWELLFAKCATSEQFRNDLGEALRHNRDPEVRELLADIGVSGEGAEQQTARIAALKEAFPGLANVASVFGTRAVGGP